MVVDRFSLSEEHSPSEERIVEVYRAQNANEAHLMSQMLQSLGIHAHAAGGALESIHGAGFIGPMNSVGVVVQAKDADRSRAEIAKWSGGRSARQVSQPARRWRLTLTFLCGAAFLLAASVLLLAKPEWRNVLFAIFFWFVIGALMVAGAIRNRSANPPS